MLNSEHIDVRSIEELVLAVQPVDVGAFESEDRDAVHAQLRRMKKNVSAVLSFTSNSLTHGLDPELKYAVEQLRRECLVINGMISRMLVVQWAKDSSGSAQIIDLLAHYRDMGGSACRMCLLSAPQLGNKLARAL